MRKRYQSLFMKKEAKAKDPMGNARRAVLEADRRPRRRRRGQGAFVQREAEAKAAAAKAAAAKAVANADLQRRELDYVRRHSCLACRRESCTAERRWIVLRMQARDAVLEQATLLKEIDFVC